MKTSSIARRALVTGGAVLVCLIGAGVAPGDSGNGGGPIPVPPQPSHISAGSCGFPIDVEPVSGTQYLISDTTLPDGTEIQQFTGDYVLSFTNLNTGETIVERQSGRETFTVYPDGSTLDEESGLGGLAIGPRGKANTGQPGLVFTSGHLVVFRADGIAVSSLTLSGREQNGCELLS
jgi:hypothetical protein